MASAEEIRDMGPNGRLALDAWHEARLQLKRVREALDYVLPYVNVDIRDKALQIARGELQTMSSARSTRSDYGASAKAAP